MKTVPQSGALAAQRKAALAPVRASNLRRASQQVHTRPAAEGPGRKGGWGISEPSDCTQPCFPKQADRSTRGMCPNRCAAGTPRRCRIAAWRTSHWVWSGGGPVLRLSDGSIAYWSGTERWARPASSSATPPTDTRRTMFPLPLTTSQVTFDPMSRSKAARLILSFLL